MTYVNWTTWNMCPHCGALFGHANTKIPVHGLTLRGARCPGSEQVPRNPETDRRALWNGEPNPHLPGQPSSVDVMERLRDEHGDVGGICTTCHDGWGEPHEWPCPTARVLGEVAA